MFMKFNVGEGVKIRGKDIVGEVVQTEYKEVHYPDGQKRISKRYLVKHKGTILSQWYDECMLVSEDKLSDTYKDEVYRLLIDVNLMVGNFEMVKMLVEEKKKYMK